MTSYRDLQKMCLQHKEKHTLRCNSPKSALEALSRDLLQHVVKTNGRNTVRILSWNIWYKTKKAEREIIIETLKKSDADIIAIQEGCGASRFRKFAAENGYLMSHLSNLGKEQQFTLWRPSVGNAVQICKGLFERGRPYTVIRFSNPSFVFVNLHAGHNYDTAVYFRRIALSPQDTRVIMAGDFNKNMKQLRLGGIKLVCGAKETLKTCCVFGPNKVAKMTHAADHILSNMEFSQNTRVFPHGHAASDHLPITASVSVS